MNVRTLAEDRWTSKLIRRRQAQTHKYASNEVLDKWIKVFK